VAAAMWVRLSNSGAELGMAHVVNASISGAFLETALRLPVNANIVLEPTTSAGAAFEVVRLAARVARVDQNGMGIEWRAVAKPETLELLGVDVNSIHWPIHDH
jgi:hypothetical protein